MKVYAVVVVKPCDYTDATCYIDEVYSSFVNAQKRADGIRAGFRQNESAHWYDRVYVAEKEVR